MRMKVRAGYNQGDYPGTYRDRTLLTPFERHFFVGLLKKLKRKSEVLDIGSGSGLPYDLHLSQQGLAVTGIDLSEKHVALAQTNVPSARYVRGDFLDYCFPDGHFDAVVFLYALFHMPRAQHAQVIAKIARILKPNGRLLITVGTEDVEYKEREDFCGAPMAWSYFDTETNLNILSACGFEILEFLNEKEYGSNEKHVWVLAEKRLY